MPGENGELNTDLSTSLPTAPSTPDTGNVGLQIPPDLMQLMNTQINAAITSHLKRLKAETVPAPAPVPAPTPALPAPTSQNPELAALQLQLKTLTEQAEAEKNLRRQMESDRARERMTGELREQLRSNKVGDAYLDMAVNSLLYQNRVGIDENGVPYFKVKVAPYQGAPFEDVSVTLSEGVKHFLQEPSSKHLIPAPIPTQTPSVNGGELQRRMMAQINAGTVPTLSRSDKDFIADQLANKIAQYEG